MKWRVTVYDELLMTSYKELLETLPLPFLDVYNEKLFEDAPLEIPPRSPRISRFRQVSCFYIPIF